MFAIIIGKFIVVFVSLCVVIVFGLFLVQAPIQVYGLEGRYAHALFSAASKKKSLEAVEGELNKFQVIYLYMYHCKAHSKPLVVSRHSV